MAATFPLTVAILLLLMTGTMHGQAPFYTDDPATADKGVLHVEFFNEHDALQLQYPNTRQNTANLKINYGLKSDVEVDLDIPFLAVYRSGAADTSTGIGDLNLGVKRRFHEEGQGAHLPSIAASFYVELPTGDAKKQLGSGIADYWLNIIFHKSLTGRTRLTADIGYLFAGNTSTGALGTQTIQGHILPAGLSLQRAMNSNLTLGAEIYGAYTANQSLGKAQLQSMVGGRYAITRVLNVDFSILGGRYVASPKIGGQVGFTVDVPLF